MSLLDTNIDHDAESRHQLDQRRESQRLALGFYVAVAAALELMSWVEVQDPLTGTRQWRAPGSSDALATLRPERGGRVDLRAGALLERHIVASELLGRLGALAKIGHGITPALTRESRTLAARVAAYPAGVFDETSIAELAADDPFMTEIWERLAP
ncbi:hypothetical protein [Achromobacter insolitus]|uniref:hypothetical protein n=1 Tax=Achromobacter insolitus TaxID=217204 RepID=UPI001EEE612A|nr:hypothetical protein [Achromobacter insolitus]